MEENHPRVKVRNASHSADTSEPAITMSDKKDESEENSKYTQIELASNFIFYPIDTLSIRPFELLDLKKLYRAKATGSMRTLAEAIGVTLDTDIFSLTVGDFWYLMYWQRINSYKKHPLKIDFTCTNEKHLEKVNKGELEKETLDNVSIVNQTDIDLIRVDNSKLESFMKDIDENSDHKVLFYPMTVGDLVESIEMIQELSKDKEDENFAEEDWFNKYASSLSSKYGNSLLERRKYLEKISSEVQLDFLVDADKFMELSDHGVKEDVEVECETCKQKTRKTLVIDALSFFP